MKLCSFLGFSASTDIGFFSEVLVVKCQEDASVIITQNFVTSCPCLQEPHGLRILAVEGLHHGLHGFQLTKVFQNCYPARAFLNWDEREGVFL